MKEKRFFSKSKVKVFPRIRKASLNEVFKDPWYKQLVIFASLPLFYVVIVILRLINNFCVMCRNANTVARGYTDCPEFQKRLFDEFNNFELFILFGISILCRVYIWFESCWTIAVHISALTDKQADNELYILPFFKRVVVRCFVAMIKMTKWFVSVFKRHYPIKGTTIAIAIVVIILSALLVGFKVNETTKMQCSINAQTEFSYYEVQPNDGWDKIALRYKPDFMGIREDVFSGNEYNYSYYLKLANPEVTELHPHMIIKCPIFENIY